MAGINFESFRNLVRTGDVANNDFGKRVKLDNVNGKLELVGKLEMQDGQAEVVQLQTAKENKELRAKFLEAMSESKLYSASVLAQIKSKLNITNNELASKSLELRNISQLISMADELQEMRNQQQTEGLDIIKPQIAENFGAIINNVFNCENDDQLQERCTLLGKQLLSQLESKYPDTKLDNPEQLKLTMGVLMRPLLNQLNFVDTRSISDNAKMTLKAAFLINPNLADGDIRDKILLLGASNLEKSIKSLEKNYNLTETIAVLNEILVDQDIALYDKVYTHNQSHANAKINLEDVKATIYALVAGDHKTLHQPPQKLKNCLAQLRCARQNVQDGPENENKQAILAKFDKLDNQLTKIMKLIVGDRPVNIAQAAEVSQEMKLFLAGQGIPSNVLELQAEEEPPVENHANAITDQAACDRFLTARIGENIRTALAGIALEDNSFEKLSESILRQLKDKFPGDKLATEFVLNDRPNYDMTEEAFQELNTLVANVKTHLENIDKDNTLSPDVKAELKAISLNDINLANVNAKKFLLDTAAEMTPLMETLAQACKNGAKQDVTAAYDAIIKQFDNLNATVYNYNLLHSNAPINNYSVVKPFVASLCLAQRKEVNEPLVKNSVALDNLFAELNKAHSLSEALPHEQGGQASQTIIDKFIAPRNFIREWVAGENDYAHSHQQADVISPETKKLLLDNGVSEKVFEVGNQNEQANADPLRHLAAFQRDYQNELNPEEQGEQVPGAENELQNNPEQVEVAEAGNEPQDNPVHVEVPEAENRPEFVLEGENAPQDNPEAEARNGVNADAQARRPEGYHASVSENFSTGVLNGFNSSILNSLDTAEKRQEQFNNINALDSLLGRDGINWRKNGRHLERKSDHSGYGMPNEIKEFYAADKTNGTTASYTIGSLMMLSNIKNFEDLRTAPNSDFPFKQPVQWNDDPVVDWKVKRDNTGAYSIKMAMTVHPYAVKDGNKSQMLDASSSMLKYDVEMKLTFDENGKPVLTMVGQPTITAKLNEISLTEADMERLSTLKDETTGEVIGRNAAWDPELLNDKTLQSLLQGQNNDKDVIDYLNTKGFISESDERYLVGIGLNRTQVTRMIRGTYPDVRLTKELMKRLRSKDERERNQAQTELQALCEKYLENNWTAKTQFNYNRAVFKLSGAVSGSLDARLSDFRLLWDYFDSQDANHEEEMRLLKLLTSTNAQEVSDGKKELEEVLYNRRKALGYDYLEAFQPFLPSLTLDKLNHLEEGDIKKQVDELMEKIWRKEDGPQNTQALLKLALGKDNPPQADEVKNNAAEEIPEENNEIDNDDILGLRNNPQPVKKPEEQIGQDINIELLDEEADNEYRPIPLNED